MTQTFEWKERGHKWYYFNTATGKIAGTVNKQALDEIWIALVYTGQYTFTLDDERHLGLLQKMRYSIFGMFKIEHCWKANASTCGRIIV